MILLGVVEVEECVCEDVGLFFGIVCFVVLMSFGILYVGLLILCFFDVYFDVLVDLYLSDVRIDLVGDGFDVVLWIGVFGDFSLFVCMLCLVEIGFYVLFVYFECYGNLFYFCDLKEY